MRSLRSLMTKLIIAFLIASVVGMGLSALFIRQFVGQEFDDYVVVQRRNSFINAVSAYYSLNGTWDGIRNWMEKQYFHRDGPPFPLGQQPYADNGIKRPERYQDVPFVLLDTTGRVLIGFGPYQEDQQLDIDDFAEQEPVSIDGTQVGIVLTPTASTYRNPAEQEYIARTTRALSAATLIAVALALVLGIALARLITRPLRELTLATQKMASGELGQQVPVRSKDEIGILAAKFNQMSSDLAHSIQLRHQMTADIAHDLRTPLTVLSGYLESLRDGVLKPTQQRFSTLYDETQILLQLVEDLHTLSLADAGELTVAPRWVSARQCLEHTAATYQHAAERHDVTLNIEAPAEPGASMIFADSDRLTRVLNNLVSNALRHTPPGGTLTLGCQRTDGATLITVADTGEGIAAEHLPNIFERFYRADSSRHLETGGSGLGLAIVRSIIELHGGSISVASTRGEGTTFTLTFPNTSAAPQEAPDEFA